MPVQSDQLFTSDPYYDDFDERMNFYRILFRPSYAVQARELTQIQTLLQDQLTKTANVSFRDGDLVAGGGLTVDTTLASVKLENTFDNATVNAQHWLGSTIYGAADGGVGVARGYVVAVSDRDSFDPNTLIVRYVTDLIFADGVTIYDADRTLEATTVSATGASKTPNASNVASIVSVDESVYYVSGFLNYVAPQTLILEKYANTPSYSIGFNIDEVIVDEADQNSSPVFTQIPIGETLLDPANGAYNYNAPGATRYRQILNIAKRTFSNTDVIEAEGNTRFVELFRINRGEVSSNYDSIYPNDTFRTRPTHQKKQIDPLLVSAHQSRGTQGFTNTSVQSTITGKGTAFLTDFAVGDKIYLEKDQYYGNGTVSFNGSGFITGQNTTFSNDFSAGKFITVNDKDYEIANVLSNTSMFIIGQTDKNIVENPYIVKSARATEVLAIGSDTSMTVNALVGDGTDQKIINANTFTVRVEGGATINGEEVTTFQASKDITIRKPRDTQYINNVSVGVGLQNYFVVSGEQDGHPTFLQGPGAFDLEGLGEVVHLHSSPFANTSTLTQIMSTVVATARVRDFMPLFVDNVDQGKNGYGIALWNIEPRTVANTIGVAGDTTGFYANDTFLTLNGPTAQLDDAYNGVTLEFTSGKLAGFQTRIKTYFANSSLIVDSLPNMPANNDGYRLLFQTKDVKSICAQNNSTLSISTKYQVSNVYGKVSNTILGYTYRDSVLFKQSQTPQFLYETPYQLKSLRTQGGTVKTSYKSRRRELVTIVPQAGTAGSMTVDSGIQFTFPFFDGVMDAQDARESFQVFVAATSDNINTPVGNSLAISGQLDSVTLGGGGAGGGAGKATSATFFISDRGAATQAYVVATVEAENMAFKTKTLINQTGFIVEEPNTTLGGLDSVQKTDIYRIRAVIDSQVDVNGNRNILSSTDLQTAAQGGTLSGANTVYVTENYELDTGQRDDYYDHGGVRLVGAPPTGQIGIVFDYFEHDAIGSAAYFSTDSYPNVFEPEDIPVYTTSAGRKIPLANAIDFRPAIQDYNYTATYYANTQVDDPSTEGDVWDSLLFLPTMNDGVSVSLGYFTKRIDTIMIDAENEIELIRGQEDTEPEAPMVKKDELELFDILVYPYARSLREIKIKPKFADYNLEYDLFANFAEGDTYGQPTGLVRAYVESFEGFGKADIGTPEFSMAIDTKDRVLHSMKNVQTWDMEFAQNASRNVTSYDDKIIVMEHTNVDAIQQPYYSNTIAINPFGRSKFQGQLKMTPSMNPWFDDNVKPTVAVNEVGENDMFEVGVVNYLNCSFNFWQTYWWGQHSRKDRFKSISTRQFQSFSDRVPYAPLPIQFNEELNDNVTRDASVIPYMPSQDIFFNAEGLKPYTNVFMYVDGERVDHRFVSLPQGLVFEDVNITGSQFEIGETVSQVTNVGTAEATVVHSFKPTTDRTTVLVIRTSVADFDVDAEDTVDGQTSAGRGNLFNVEAVATEFEANQYGIVAGLLRLPPGRFTATDKLIQITDKNTYEAGNVGESTFAEFKYQARPSYPMARQTRPNELRRSDNRDETVYYTEFDREKYTTDFTREFAQCIYVDPAEYPKGYHMTGFAIYVANTDSLANTGSPLKFSLRPMVDGYPSPSEILPFSEKIVQATEVRTTVQNNLEPDSQTTNDGDGNGTKVYFRAPVYLYPGREYALVIDTDNPEYKLHVGRIGETLTNLTHRIRPYKELPRMFRRNNNGGWMEDKFNMLTMQTYRADFYTGSSYARFVMKQPPVANVKMDGFHLHVGDVSYGNVAFIDYQWKGSSETQGDDLDYRSFGPNENYWFNSISKINEQRVISTSANSFVLNAVMYTSHEDLSPVFDFEQMKLVTWENVIDNAQLNNDAFVIENPGLGYHFDTTVNGNTEATIAISGGDRYANGDEIAVATLNMGAGGRISSVNVINGGSGYTGNVSVVITNKAGEAAPTTDAVIRVKSETDPYLGLVGSRYISKVFEIGDTANALKVMLEGKRPGGSNIKVYMRAVSGFDNSRIYDAWYQEIPMIGDSNTVYSDVFTEFCFETSTDFLLRDQTERVFGEFSTFQLKVVFTSEDTSRTPEVKNMRIFAFNRNL